MSCVKARLDLITYMKSLQAPNLIPFDNPTNIDNVKEESEGYGSKIDSVYDGLHKKSSDIFNVCGDCARISQT